MAAEKAWHKAFTSGSKALQDKLRKVHAKNPEFQSFLGKHGFEGGSSVKQASKAQTVSKEVAAKRTELSNKAYGATTGAKVGGDHVELKDTIAPLTKDQHSKVQVAKKAALTKDERFAAIARASRKSRTGERYEVPTEDPDDAGHEDMMDLHHSLHIGHGSVDEAIRGNKYSNTMDFATSPDEEGEYNKKWKPKLSDKSSHELWSILKDVQKNNEKKKSGIDSFRNKQVKISGLDHKPYRRGTNEEVELDEATKAYKDPITGQVTQIPAHKAPTYGFNKFGQFASLDRAPKPRKKLHNTAHHLMRTVDEFEEGTPERQAVTDALKKVVGAIKEGFDDPEQIAKYLADKHGAENVRPEHIKTLERDSNSSLDVDVIMQHVRKLQEGIDPNDVLKFGANFAAYEYGIKPAIDHIVKPVISAARKKLKDKLASKPTAPAAVSEASLAADIQRDVDARNKRLADAASKARKKKIADAKVAAAGKQTKEMDKLKNLSKYGSDEEKEYAKGEIQRIKNLEEANFKYEVDHMPGQTVRGTLPKSCPTCYGRKAMYKTPEGKMYADKKTEDSKRVACPDCQGKGYVAEESNEDSNYLNNKKNQIRESIQSKLAAKTGKK